MSNIKSNRVIISVNGTIKIHDFVIVLDGDGSQALYDNGKLVASGHEADVCKYLAIPVDYRYPTEKFINDVLFIQDFPALLEDIEFK